jgi:hypothetical protein
MNEKAVDVYQGNDWITYRWSVAQVFDTLDQIRELCGVTPDGFSTTQLGAPATGKTTTIVTRQGDEPESHLEALSLLLSLCDDLASETHTVLADLAYQMRPSPALQWKGFEMQLHLAMIRQHCLPDEDATGVSKSAIDSILALSLRIRDLLKQIDQ